MKILRTFKGDEFELTDAQAAAAAKAIMDKQDALIIGGTLLKVSAIELIADTQSLDDGLHRRNGDWLCKHDRWHEKGGRCFGHDAWDKQNERQYMPLNGGSPLIGGGGEHGELSAGF